MKKYGISIALLVLMAVPAFAQQDMGEDTGENVLREIGMFGAYAEGDIALKDLERGNDPIQQLKRFFLEASLPLTSAQERQLKTNIDIVYKNLQAANSDDEVRKANVQFNKTLFGILNADQQAALKRYRNQQIMMHGGFPALKLMLENAKAPLTPEQEKEAQTIYQEFNQQADRLTSESKDPSNKATLAKLESDALGRVVKLLTSAQRKALNASRLGALNAKTPR